MTFASVLEPFAPAKLGRSFRWLLGSALFSNLGDGIALAAGPLLVASQTDDAFLVAMAYFAQVTPPLLFSIWAGAAADRLDRRMIAILLNLARAVILAILAVAIATGVVNIALVLGALFLLSTGETFADIAEGSLLPRLVPREHLAIANARMSGAFLGVNQLIAPPIGAFLFVAGAAIPFAANAICFALGAVLITRLATDVGRHRRASRAEGDEAANPAPQAQGVLRDIADGMRWLAKHPAMRTLVITIVAFNVTYGAAWSVLVLYVRDQLGMGEIGYGIVTAASALGGIVGTIGYGALTRRFTLGNLMRAGLIIETLTHLSLALTRVPIVAMAILFVFGAHAFVWGTTATTIRQRAVPDELFGRVSGVYRVGIFGGLVFGAPIGGFLAQTFGIAAPFWFGFVGSAILVVLLWREFALIAHDDEAASAPA
ncbi:MAG TPA: MFS transporter [Candidatus Limnocylindrales bacterium]|nr:MFS transporter [Candidatus Limnocylindrales bacterium]